MHYYLKVDLRSQHILPRLAVAAVAQSTRGNSSLRACSAQNSFGVHAAAGPRERIVDIESEIQLMHDKLGKLERIVDADVAHFQEVGFLHEEVREVQPSLGLRGAFERRVRYGVVLDALRKSELAVEGVNVSPRLIVAHECKVQPLRRSAIRSPPFRAGLLHGVAAS